MAKKANGLDFVSCWFSTLFYIFFIKIDTKKLRLVWGVAFYLWAYLLIFLFVFQLYFSRFGTIFIIKIAYFQQVKINFGFQIQISHGLG